MNLMVRKRRHSHHKRHSSRTREKRGVPFFLRIGTKGEQEYFIDNLGMLFSSGMDIITSLRALRSEMRTKGMQVAIDGIHDDIDAGYSVWKALDNTGLLPEYVISLVRVGEETGRLSENLKVIVKERQKSRSFRSKIHSAMLYPLLVFGLTFVIGVSIAWFVLPRLATVFEQLNIELPLVTEILIGFGSFLGDYGFIVMPFVIIFLVTLMYFLFFYSRTRFIGQVVLFRTPHIRKVIQEVELARLGFVLGTLLNAGVPITYALASLRDATQFHAHQGFYRHLHKSIENGNSFQISFDEYSHSRRFIPLPIQEMIVSAEQSGTLPETLMNVGKIYEEKTEITTKNLAVILEPILLVIVWFGVVGVALAIILPIYSLIGGLN
jgi:type II secretory pathway component PulF